MPKTATFTTITPLPSGVTRKSVVDMFQDHLAMIDLNPLVVERFKCRPPSYATTDEYYQTWYTIKDKVSYLPGGLATGSVSYHACFHDVTEGLETHVYAPLGLDIRGKWSVGGTLPGEPKPLGPKDVSAPRNGLYIREDVKMTCSSLLMSFVKRTFKDSHASLVEKLVERAHVLESSFANERLQALRNVAPGERMATGDIFIAPPPDYQAPAEASSSQQSPQATESSHHSRTMTQPSLQYTPPVLASSSQQSPATTEPSQQSRTAAQAPPHYSPPAHASHSRSHSDPVTSPGFSSASTLHSDSSSPIVYTNYPSPSPFNKYVFEEQVSSSAPTSTSFLLPATTYDGGLSQPKQKDRPLSLYPGGSHVSHRRDDSNPSLFPPRVFYSPQERPISFTFPTSPFDTHSVSESNRNSDHLLEEIDDAIDQCFRDCIVQKAISVQIRPEPALLLLPSTRYDPRQNERPKEPQNDRHARKDSVMPMSACLDKELPPTPLHEA